MTEQPKTDRLDPFLYVLAAVLFWAGAGAVGAVMVVIFQSMQWLKTGNWNPLPADWVFDAVGLTMPVTHMVGAERIIEFVVWLASPAPLAITALLIGFLPVIFLLIAMNWVGALMQDIAMHRNKRKAGG